MHAFQRLILLCLALPAALAVALGGPVHLLVAHAPHVEKHSHAVSAGCHHHQDAAPADPGHAPAEPPSHTCPTCVLLSLGSTLPTATVELSGQQPVTAAVVTFQPLELPSVDLQLPGARAPPNTAS